MDEEKHLKYSLAVFFGTYFLRACLYTTIILGNEIWRRMWTNYPVLTETLFTGSQLIYDIWPILLIMQQHHRTFKNEERYETSFLMDRLSSSTFITSGRDVSMRADSTLDEINLKNMQLVERMRAKTVQN